MVIIAQVVVFAIILFLTICTYKIIMPLRDKISCRTGMMATMIISSMVGLLAGTILALNQNYTMNSLLSMLIGIGAGVMIGILFNSMTMLEGLMGGVMGGLMGAMLGEMLPTNSIYLVGFVLAIISLISLYLLGKSLKAEAGIEKEYQASGKVIKNVSFLIGFVTVAVFLFVIAGPLDMKSEPMNEKHVHSESHHMDH